MASKPANVAVITVVNDVRPSLTFPSSASMSPRRVPVSGISIRRVRP
ncbi:MAG: hypothetical protein ABSA02_30445 [Trebonia sp.]